MPIDLTKIKHFSPASDPAINWDLVDQTALEMLDAAREKAGVPFKITSTYRTPGHSLAVGGLNNDSHVEDKCSAFDVAYGDTLTLYKIVTAAIAAGFPRVGVNPFNMHVHLDNSQALPSPRFWVETPEQLMVKSLIKNGYLVEKAH